MKVDSYRLAGYLLVSMILFSILHKFNPEVPLIMSGLCGWTALFFLSKKLAKQQLILFSILSTSGLVCVLWAQERGVTTDISSIINKNYLLLSLFVGVSFLRLVTLPNSENNERVPKGKKSFIRTLIGTHIFSAVINLSAVMIVAEYLNPKKKPDHLLAILLSRAYGAAAFWSPFFAAMATALTYSPQASLGKIIIMGLPLSIAGFFITLYSLNNRDNKLETFTGYPLHFSALWIPGLLAICVLFINYNFPNISILVVITFLSILITLIVLFISKPREIISILDHHIVTALPGMANELGLFLSAGVLAVGLSSVLSSYHYIPEFTNLGPLLMISLLLIMVVLAFFGIHPVITIAIVGAWLEPLHLDPDLLALVFVFAWGLGITISPLSGLNLVLQGRFGVSGSGMVKWNALYSVHMMIVASFLLWLYSQ